MKGRYLFHNESACEVQLHFTAWLVITLVFLTIGHIIIIMLCLFRCDELQFWAVISRLFKLILDLFLECGNLITLEHSIMLFSVVPFEWTVLVGHYFDISMEIWVATNVDFRVKTLNIKAIVLNFKFFNGSEQLQNGVFW